MNATLTAERTAIQNPADFLRAVFLERRERNLLYSTRAFARDLGISQALLSMVLGGKRPLTAKQAAKIGALLGLSPGKAQELLESALRSLPNRSKSSHHLTQHGKARPLFKDYAVERFKAISQWHHVAILDLSTTYDFRNDLRWIARRLGISTIEARDALTRLLDLGFLIPSGDSVKKSDEQIYFSTKKSELAIRAFHKSMLSKAQLKLDETTPEAFAQREISAITMAARRDRIPEAKKRIQKFQKNLAAFLTEGECDEVFQLNVQLFPLTKSEY